MKRYHKPEITLEQFEVLDVMFASNEDKAFNDDWFGTTDSGEGM